jgi:hypothetical protein
MLSVKNILFVPQYQFENKNSPDEKILLVLAAENNISIVYTLTTSQDTYIPNEYKKVGCVNDGLNFSMYVFEKGKIIGTKPNGQPFAFNKETYIVFNNFENIYDTSRLLEEYPDTSLLATFYDDVFDKFINCLKASSMVKRKYKRILG